MKTKQDYHSFCFNDQSNGGEALILGTVFIRDSAKLKLQQSIYLSSYCNYARLKLHNLEITPENLRKFVISLKNAKKKYIKDPKTDKHVFELDSNSGASLSIKTSFEGELDDPDSLDDQEDDGIVLHQKLVLKTPHGTTEFSGVFYPSIINRLAEELDSARESKIESKPAFDYDEDSKDPLENLKRIVSETEKDYVQADSGNVGAGTRVRAQMQNVRKLAKDIKDIIDWKF